MAVFYNLLDSLIAPALLAWGKEMSQEVAGPCACGLLRRTASPVSPQGGQNQGVPEAPGLHPLAPRGFTPKTSLMRQEGATLLLTMGADSPLPVRHAQRILDS